VSDPGEKGHDMPETRVTILVCASCRRADEPGEPRDERSGARLARALAEAADGAPGVTVLPVECLSVCKRPVTIGFSAAGKWTYVYGDFAETTEAAARRILAAAEQYRAAPDGLIPWKERPDALKKGVVARIPPIPAVPEAAE
jgi:predicted metal-binding protein